VSTFLTEAGAKWMVFFAFDEIEKGFESRIRMGSDSD
jgi:hypothetical protein